MSKDQCGLRVELTDFPSGRTLVLTRVFSTMEFTETLITPKSLASILANDIAWELEGAIRATQQQG